MRTFYVAIALFSVACGGESFRTFAPTEGDAGELDTAPDVANVPDAGSKPAVDASPGSDGSTGPEAAADAPSVDIGQPLGDGGIDGGSEAGAACDLKPCSCGSHVALCCNGPCPTGFEGLTCYCGDCPFPKTYHPDAGSCE